MAARLQRRTYGVCGQAHSLAFLKDPDHVAPEAADATEDGPENRPRSDAGDVDHRPRAGAPNGS
jgi:hypothetical protein